MSAPRDTRRVFAHALSRKSAVLMAGLVLPLAWLPWLWLLGGAAYPAGLQDRCLGRAAERYGDDARMTGDAYVRWFPPAWVCPVDRDRAITLSICNF